VRPPGPDVKSLEFTQHPRAVRPSEERALRSDGPTSYTPEQGERLQKIHARVIEARRELDALIGDAYLRPRASIVPVHFLDLAAAVEKLRWAEKEWRELDQELAATAAEEPDEPDPGELAEDAGGEDLVRSGGLLQPVAVDRQP
jgi:hypothetical protein